MFLKRVRTLTDKAQQELERLRQAERAITEHLVEVFAEVVRASADAKGPTDGGTEVSKILNREGGTEHLLEQCDQVSAHHGDRYQPLMKNFYGSIEQKTRTGTRRLTRAQRERHNGLCEIWQNWYNRRMNPGYVR